jgi:hypothetical protein
MHLPRGCSRSWETPPRLGRPKKLRLFAVWDFRDDLASAIRKACSGLSQLASLVIHGPVAVAPRPFPELKCVAEARDGGASPVSVEHHFGGGGPAPPPASKREALPVAALSITFLYQELIRHRLWNARFERGGSGDASGRPPVRSLATRHWSEPAVDGWNAVAGAVDLAEAWAFEGALLPPEARSAYDLPRDVRMRLTVCLSVAWKFERQLSSRFPRTFYDDEPNLVSPHTCELAYLGYSFLSVAERAEFGPWGQENGPRVRALYAEMIALEASLLLSVPVFSTLVDGNQVQAEARLQALLDAGVLTVAEVMAARAIVPYFNAVWLNGRSERPTAGGLACVTALCVCSSVATPGLEAKLRPWFVPTERRRARALLLNALHPQDIPKALLSLGCYADPDWKHYDCISPHTLELALVASNKFV